MFNSAILSIAIALVFIFLLLAVMVTAINEVFFTFMRARAKQLEYFLKKLYFEDGPWDAIFEKLKNSPFINVLKKDPDKFPSSIPAEAFTTALLAQLGKNDLSIAAIRKAVEENDAFEAAEALKPRDGKPYRPSDFFAMLKTLLSENPTLDQLRAEMDKIFNNAMDRLTGWYRWNAKIMSFIFAFLICAGLNVDTITITKNLWNNKDKAEQIASFASAASKYFEKNDSSQVVFKDGIDTLAYIKVENQALTQSKVGKAVATLDTAGADKKQQKQLVTSYHILASLDIPIGWTKENIPARSGNCWLNFGMWLLKILGILLTTAAVSLGAPYWFDILSRITPLKQAAGKPGGTDGSGQKTGDQKPN